MHNKSINLAFDKVTLASSTITAFQTTRLHPISHLAQNTAYGGFNLGLHVGDKERQVLANRQFLLESLPCGSQIQWLDQVHGNLVARLDEHCSHPVVADAAITSKRKLALAVMTADCLPILLKSRQEDEIAVIHGGWRPLCANIIANTIAKMKTDPSDIKAWLGPSIGAKRFEVGKEVKFAFESFNNDLVNCFQEKSNSKYLADLPKIASLLLRTIGVTNLSVNSPCTVSNSGRYYSYRKDKITGRMASIIMIN